MSQFKSEGGIAPKLVAAGSAAVVGRFAPTPSGPLHAGSLLAALGSFLSARAQGGRWLVRIEDIDPPREVAGAATAILQQLRQLGLDWDGEVVYQSRRSEAYAEALDRLRSTGLAFRCACSRQDLAPCGLHRGGCVRPLGGHSTSAWRIRVDDDEVAIADRYQGRYGQRLATEVGDFVLRRRDGYWAYHLAVVVDDAAAGVSEVIRGADLLDSTPRQVLLQQRLGLPTPAYGHLPLLLDGSGEKLSKSRGAADLGSRQPVEWLRLALGWLGQPLPEGQSCGGVLAAAIRDWDPARVPPGRSLPCRMRPDFGREQSR